MNKTPFLSIVIPICNEEGNIKPLLARTFNVAERLKKKFEVIIIDDGSTDNSLKVLRKAQKNLPELSIISFRRNFGQTAALAAGFERSQGEVIITLDGDLQNDPEDIPLLLETIEQGYDLVSGWRKSRQDNYLVRIIPSLLANKLISFISGLTLHDYGCTLKAFRADLAKSLNLYGEMHRFIPAVAAAVGARIIEVPVQHHARVSGKSKYGLSRVIRVFLDLITVKFLTSFMTRPIHLFGQLGLGLSIIGSLIFGYLVYEKMVLIQPLADRPLFLISIFFILLGIQFITIGILAEMLVRIYYESQHKKTYHIREVIE